MKPSLGLASNNGCRSSSEAFRRDGDEPVACMHVERPDSQHVASANECLARVVPDREGEVAQQPCGARLSPAFVGARESSASLSSTAPTPSACSWPTSSSRLSSRPSRTTRTVPASFA